MKQIFTLTAALFALVSCTSRQSGYTIDGTVAGVDGKVYLTVYEGKMPHIIDSTTVEDGKFTFEGVLDMPMLASVDVADGNVSLGQFFLENSPIAISGDIADKRNIAVVGSQTNDLYNNLALLHIWRCRRS